MECQHFFRILTEYFGQISDADYWL